jgi:hypothetical protein
MDMGAHADGYFQNHKTFIEPYFKVSYLEDTIVVTTLLEINCCGTMEGDIEISNDSIFLLAKNTSEYACTCLEYHKFSYTIHNPENRKYVIISAE